MPAEPQKLLEAVSVLRDEDLWRMVYLESDQYRPEALTYAKAEIRRRGITFDPKMVDSMPPLPLATFGRSLRRVKPTLAFGLGFMCSLAYFVWGNIESYRKMYKGGCSDCFVFFGYPFKLYQTGGFAGPTAFLWGGLIADVAIVTIVSVSVGWLLKILTRKIAHEPDAV